MGKIIAIVNQKGGVGKTTTCVNLCDALQLRKRNILLCDCDPQGNSTSGVGVDKNSSPNVYDIIMNGVEAEKAVVKTKYCSLIPSNRQLSGAMQASRVHDNARYINIRNNTGKFIRQVDAPRKLNDHAFPFYEAELKDLIHDLEELSGVKVTDERLKAAVEKSNEVRRLVAELFELRKEENPVISGADCLRITLAVTNMPIDEYAELLKAFLADAKSRKPVTGHRCRVMVIGSALDDPKYLELIESKGALVVQDALCFGGRGFNVPIEIDDRDVLGSISKYYLEHLVCPRMMDKHFEMDDYIMDTCKAWNVDGIIYERMQYCEIWGGESAYFLDRFKNAGIPVLTVEREEQLSNEGQLGIRVEAFVEMIESNK